MTTSVESKRYYLCAFDTNTQSNVSPLPSQYLSWTSSLISAWRESPPTPPFSALVHARSDLDSCRRGDKRKWARERSDLEELLLNIQTKLKTYGLRSYEPEGRYSVAVSLWASSSDGS